MAVKLLSVNTNVLGHFNPHIIAPKWLAEQGIIEVPPDQFHVQIANMRDVTFTFSADDLEWNVSADRVIISSKHGVDTAAKLAEVLDRLPHTPVRAVGSNFRYRCEPDSWQGPLPQLGDRRAEDLSDGGDVLESAWRAKFASAGDLFLSVEIHATDESVIVALNYHRDAKDHDAAVTALAGFRADQAASVQWVRAVLGSEVEG